ncbi:hypothetical protein [uncultured Helicobacter sp.]|uniref:hypothetical protein n=1 Tax=uncultured Helicobacter sp. TaxID=175537 RepID=UPI0025FD6D43|nr:hypothetical protein [uncultured Helicobacter sp.]
MLQSPQKSGLTQNRLSQVGSSMCFERFQSLKYPKTRNSIQTSHIKMSKNAYL